MKFSSIFNFPFVLLLTTCQVVGVQALHEGITNNNLRVLEEEGTDEIQFKLQEATVADIQNAVKAGALTYETLVGLYFNRIAEYDDEINSVMRVNPSAVIEARALDLERQEGIIRGPLHGIPILLKDNIDQLGDPTTGGSIALQECMPMDDSTIVQRLVEAGAVILGKTAMSEFALSYGRLGYSSLGGTVLNPYNPMRSTSGSSSGSAAAVAAGFAPLALGSDTAGSIRGPASSANLVGIKPTRGFVSLDGVLPLSPWADVVGPIGQAVSDVALVMGALAGPDSNDNTTASSEGNALDDYTSYLVPGALSGKTFAKIAGFSGGNDEVDGFFNQAITDIESLGGTVIEVNFTEYIEDEEILDGFISGWSILGPILSYECVEPMDDYLAAGTNCPSDLAAVVNITIAYADTPTAMNPSRLEGFQTCLTDALTMDDPEYLRLTETVVPAMEAAVQVIMQELGIDAFIYPTMLCPSRVTWYEEDPSYECSAGDQWVAGYIANILGWPDITIPMGITEASAPTGISFLGEKWSESALIGYAYDYEQSTMHRTLPPGFEPLSGEEFTFTDSMDGDVSVARIEDGFL